LFEEELTISCIFPDFLRFRVKNSGKILIFANEILKPYGADWL